MTFTFTDIILLCFGVFIGIVWGAFIFIKRKRSFVLKHINKGFSNINNEERKLINDKINDVYSYHLAARRTNVKLLFGIINMKRKVDYKMLAENNLGISDRDSLISLVDELMWLVEEVASIYYPDSKNPLFELTIEELFLLIREIISLLSNVVYDIGIPNLEKLKVSTIKDLVLFGGKVMKVYNLRSVRITIGFINAAFKIQSVVTPIYWIKKGTNDLSITSLSQFIIKCMFEIVGKETANIYSKNFIEKKALYLK